MVERDLRIFAPQRLGHDLAPQPRAREDVRLVDRMNRQRRVRRERDLRRHARDALHFLDAVDHRVPRNVLLRRDVLLLALAKVDAADELADDDDVDTPRDGLLQRRVDDERVGCEVRGADVGVHAEGLAERKEASFRAHFAIDAPFWAADGTYGESGGEGVEARSIIAARYKKIFFWFSHTHQYGVCFFARLQGGSGQRLAQLIDGTPSEEVRLELELHLR